MVKFGWKAGAEQYPPRELPEVLAPFAEYREHATLRRAA
jgi:hypothetical protein